MFFIMELLALGVPLIILIWLIGSFISAYWVFNQEGGDLEGVTLGRFKIEFEDKNVIVIEDVESTIKQIDLIARAKGLIGELQTNLHEDLKANSKRVFLCSGDTSWDKAKPWWVDSFSSPAPIYKKEQRPKESEQQKALKKENTKKTLSKTQTLEKLEKEIVDLEELWSSGSSVLSKESTENKLTSLLDTALGALLLLQTPTIEKYELEVAQLYEKLSEITDEVNAIRNESMRTFLAKKISTL